MFNDRSLVTPGTQAFSVIAAKPDTMSAQIIDDILTNSKTSDKYPFRVIQDNRATTGWAKAEVMVGFETRKVEFYVGEECDRPTTDVFQIEDRSYGISGCMRVRDSGALINVSRLNKTPSRLSGLGRQIIVSVVVHGKNWRNRSPEVVSGPFGHSATTTKRKKRPPRQRDLSEQRLML